MEKQPTCGQGLAANAVLPARIADVISALTNVLEVHVKALDSTDDRTRLEQDAYSELSQTLGTVAASLRAAAERMQGYRDLPMGRHDLDVMKTPEPIQAFERFVSCEQALLTMLEDRMPTERAMLAQMKATTAGG